MRQRFEQQMQLRTVAVIDVKFPLKGRDSIVELHYIGTSDDNRFISYF